MIGHPKQDQDTEVGAPVLSLRVQSVLVQLATARDYALDIGADPWDFAVELNGLLIAGAIAADLRWLFATGYINFAAEATQGGDLRRRFHAVQTLTFSSRTCFVLTEAGVCLVRSQLGNAVKLSKDDSLPQLQVCRLEDGEIEEVVKFSDRPHWDDVDKVLLFEGRVVKRFGYSSPNQEAVLAAFEEENWPSWINDPMRPVGDTDAKQRLRNTIRTLNSKQVNPLIHFRADGTGEHVLWERIEETAAYIVPSQLQLHRAA